MQPNKVFSDANPKPDPALFKLLYAIFHKMPQPKLYSVHSDKGEIPDYDPVRFVPADLPSLFPSTLPPSGVLVYEGDWTQGGTRKHSILVKDGEIVATNDKLKSDSEKTLTLQELKASGKSLKAHAEEFVEYLKKGMPQGSTRE